MRGETSRSYQRPYRPAPVALANALGRAAARAGLRASFDEAQLLARARRRTGLEDFGVAEFLTPLRALLSSLEYEAELHPIGRLMVQQILLRQLESRLRITALCARHPEIEARPVEGPIFIVGLQRTGTTLLQRLLAQHPALRVLASFEAISPAPPLERPLRPGEPDPRIRLARLAERAARYMAPDFFAIHPIIAEGNEEDSLLFDPSFYSTTAEALANVPSFMQWLAKADHRSSYAEYRRVIQLLLWQRPGRWLGKTPLHLEHLGTLLETFPDARILHTHRDPVETVASLCSMIAHGRGFFSDRVDPHELGAQWFAKTRRMVERGLAARERAGDAAFFDVPYRGMLEDPLGQIQRICEFIGAPLPQETQASMRDFLRGHPQHEHGRHVYQLEDFGLDRDELRSAFASYRSRFGFESD